MSEITDEMKQAAAILGRMGGAAGRGDAKRRSPAVIAKAVRARVAANKKRIAKRKKDAEEFRNRLQNFKG